MEPLEWSIKSLVEVVWPQKSEEWDGSVLPVAWICARLASWKRYLIILSTINSNVTTITRLPIRNSSTFIYYHDNFIFIYSYLGLLLWIAGILMVDQIPGLSWKEVSMNPNRIWIYISHFVYWSSRSVLKLRRNS